MYSVFIDGSSGTTGLRLKSRLEGRDGLKLVELDDAHRKDLSARREALNEADVVFLCLPDDAARESVSLIASTKVKVIDTSTAHRVNNGWTYGMAEMRGQREKIASSLRIANPGCHASGFIALVGPLVEAGILKADALISCFSLTGYSGGGKKMIAQYETGDREPLLQAPRLYGLNQNHKHLSEMKRYTGLENAPAFCPIVAPFYSGMEVTVPLFGINRREVENVFAERYDGGLIRYKTEADEAGFLSAAAFSGRDDMEITVHGTDERLLLVARFDNLGKGASGAAIQNMNLILGMDETAGLVV